MSKIPDWLSDPKGIPRTRDEMTYALSSGYIIEPFRENTEITAELLLDYVDLRLEWYIPSSNAFDFMNFIRLCLGKEPENTNPLAHYFFLDCLFKEDSVKPYFTVRNIDYDALKRNVLILATREFSKSVLLTYMVLYMADRGNLPNFGDVNFGVYVSDKLEKGNVTVMMDTLNNVYKGSKYLRGRFEYVHITATKAVFIRKPRSPVEIKVYNKHMSTGGKIDEVPYRMERQFALQGVGVSTGGRGVRDVLDRPDFAIFDDMLKNDEEASSKKILSKIEKVVTKDVGGSMNGNDSFKVMIGTAYNTKDPVYRRVKEGSWLPVVFPRAEEPPTDDLLEHDFQSVWPDRHSYAAQRRDYLEAYLPFKNSNNPLPLRAFMQEFFCRVSSDSDRLIPKQFIQWYDAQDVLDNAWRYNWYLTTDYTTTGSATSNNSAAFLWAISSDQHFFLVDLSLKKMGLEYQYDTTFKKVESLNGKVRWVKVGVEIDGQQVLHILALKDRQVKRNTILQFAQQRLPDNAIPNYEGIKSKVSGGDKLWRFKATVPMWEQYRIWLPKHLRRSKDMVTFLEEVDKVTPEEIKGQDDGLDAVSQLIMIDIKYPPKDIRMPNKLKNRHGMLGGNRVEEMLPTPYSRYT